MSATAWEAIFMLVVLKIPVIYGLDTVHGAGPVKGATVFPHNVGLGATRDPALVEEVARAVAEETAGVGADFPFAPVVAVARDERWGRTYESYGESPELAESLGAAAVRGFEQATDGTAILWELPAPVKIEDLGRLAACRSQVRVVGDALRRVPRDECRE